MKCIISKLDPKGSFCQTLNSYSHSLLLVYLMTKCICSFGREHEMEITTSAIIISGIAPVNKYMHKPFHFALDFIMTCIFLWTLIHNSIQISVIPWGIRRALELKTIMTARVHHATKILAPIRDATEGKPKRNYALAFMYISNYKKIK